MGIVGIVGGNTELESFMYRVAHVHLTGKFRLVETGDDETVFGINYALN